MAVSVISPTPLCLSRFRPAPEGPQHRTINGFHISPPETPGIWLGMARQGDLQLANFSQVQCLVADAPDIAICIDDELHLAIMQHLQFQPAAGCSAEACR